MDPEYRILQELKELFPETFLTHRKIPVHEIVHVGHPLYSVANTPIGEASSDKDSFFPKVGVEWSDDEPNDDIGGNYRIFPYDTPIKNKIISYKNRNDSRYENSSFEQFDAVLTSTKYQTVESYTGHVVSNLMVSGWGGSGAEGRKTAQELYKATMSLLPFLKNNIQKKYKVSISLEGKPSVNIEAPNVGRGVWGFEFMLSVRQIKREFRFLEGTGGLVKEADVYFHGKGTLSGKTNLGKSTGNMNFHPLEGKI